MLVWPAVPFLVNLWGYYWIDERKRREKVAALAITEMLHLASRVMALHSRPVFSPVERSRVAEVFALH
jgi:P2-related tail formation protein